MTEQKDSQQGISFLKKSLRRIDRENCTWAVQAAVQNSACTI
jgi:hypothetical protein